MKYTYRDECILQENGDIGSFILLGIWICATLGIFMMDGYLIFIDGSDGFGSPVVGGLFAIATAAIGITIYRSIHKRRSKALAIRRTAMEQGVRCTGRIVDAGWELESEDYDTWDENDNRVRKTKYSRNYWLDVDYCDPKSGEAKRWRAAYMRRSMECFIGCHVDIYIWQEWSKVIDAELTRVYVDTYSLDLV